MHIAIIPDGNRRWARQQNQAEHKGHEAGFQTLRTLLKECRNDGPTILSFYAFSTENFKRSPQEVNNLFRLLEDVLENFSKELHQNNVQLRISGTRQGLSSKLNKKLDKALELCSSGEFILNICFNYGAKEELISAVRTISQEVLDNNLKVDQITEQTLSDCLWNSDLPPVDLLIRSSGEYRISNFMLWQCAYAEFFFSPKLWPDFTPADLREALEEFHSRQRRYGK